MRLGKKFADQIGKPCRDSVEFVRTLRSYVTKKILLTTLEGLSHARKRPVVTNFSMHLFVFFSSTVIANSTHNVEIKKSTATF